MPANDAKSFAISWIPRVAHRSIKQSRAEQRRRKFVYDEEEEEEDDARSEKREERSDGTNRPTTDAGLRLRALPEIFHDLLVVSSTRVRSHHERHTQSLALYENEESVRPVISERLFLRPFFHSFNETTRDGFYALLSTRTKRYANRNLEIYR